MTDVVASDNTVSAEGPRPDEPGITRVLQKAALGFNRRGFIGRAGAAGFGVLAGFAVGSGTALAAGCTGPNGSGSCRNSGTCFCSSKPCDETCSTYSCTNVSQTYCGGNPDASYCWESSGHACCDCRCSNGTNSFYCFCHYTG